MIDTVKIYAEISNDIYNLVRSKSDINSKYNLDKGTMYYEIINSSINGSYESSLSVRVSDCGSKYHLSSCIIELEGSYHKITKGYNSHNGFYNVQEVVNGMISLVQNAYDIKLPDINKWFLQRIDLSYCFDLGNQENVKTYINNLSKLSFGRRETRHYENRGVYIAGSTTTLKIYNKFIDFQIHDYHKMKKADNFNMVDYLETVKGLVRFELEIRKRKLKELFSGENVKVLDVNYDKLDIFVKGEFMKLFKLNDNNICIVRTQNDVKNRLYSFYKTTKASNLYGFFLNIVNEGYNNVMLNYSSSTFYRKLGDLKIAGIDFNQTAFIVQDVKYDERFVDFMPFTDECKYREVV